MRTLIEGAYKSRFAEQSLMGSNVFSATPGVKLNGLP